MNQTVIDSLKIMLGIRSPSKEWMKNTFNQDSENDFIWENNYEKKMEPSVVQPSDSERG